MNPNTLMLLWWTQPYVVMGTLWMMWVTDFE
jgi:hypothetical protein